MNGSISTSSSEISLLSLGENRERMECNERTNFHESWEDTQKPLLLANLNYHEKMVQLSKDVIAQGMCSCFIIY